MQKFITADQDIDTKDIMYALTGALPAAVESLNRLDLPDFDSPEQVARFLQSKVNYKEDGLDIQMVQLPTALLESGVGDCKSFSLFISAVLTSYGVNNGFRFVSYAPGDVTHVYNFYLDQNDKTIYLDACLDSLQENPKYVKKIDMQVGIIGKTPIVHKAGSTIGSRNYIGFAEAYTFALPRQAFLALLKLNYRGYADVFNTLRSNQSNPVPFLQISSLWNTFGGQLNNLNIAIDQGRGKAPLFGRGNAADQQYLADQYNSLQQSLALAEFVGAAVQAGYQLDPIFKTPQGQPTVDWQLIFPGASNPPANWPQVLVALIQSIDRFFVDQGNIILNSEQGGPAVDITTVPTRPVVTVVPGTGPGRGPVSVGTLGGVEGAVALMAAAAPVLLGVSQVLKQFGLDDAANTIENVAGNLPNPPAPGFPGPGLNPPGGLPPSGTILGMPPFTALMLAAGAFLLLTNKKR